VSSTNGVKNFDQVHPENKAFILAGQEFHWTPMWWRDFGTVIEEETERFLEQQRKEEEYEAKADKLRAEGKKVPDPPTGQTLVDSYEDLIKAICRYIEPSEVDRFKEVVNDPGKRISHLQLTELRDWIREVTNNRPTEEPSPSEPGPGQTEATSQAA
jgi:hypothetical protein